MIYKIGLFLLVSSSIGSSRKIQSRKHDDSISNPMGWLFDIEAENNGENKNELRETETVCLTKECRVIADEFLRSMNKSVNPCDDFYKFTCEGWSSTNIPSYLPIWGRFIMFQEVVYKRLSGILEIDQQPDDILPVKQAKKWFKTCMDTEGLNRRGIKTLESILMRVGGWPITMDPDEWDEDAYNWEKIDNYYFQLTSSHIFYQFHIFPYVGALDVDIGISSGDLPLAEKLSVKYRNYKGNDYDAYKEFVYKVVEIFYKHNKGEDVDESKLQRDVIDLVEFEKELFMIREEYGEDGDGFQRQQIGNFINTYEEEIKKSNLEDFKIDFKKSVTELLDLVGQKYNESMEMSIKDDIYFPKLAKLLNKTPKKVIVNYMHWHFVSNMLEHTTDEMRNLIFELMEKEYGVTERAPRWLECVQLTKMKEAVAYAFMKAYFPSDTNTKMQEVINNVRGSVETLIDNSNFIGEVKKAWIKKLRNMRFLVGFPESYKNNSAIIASFRGLTIGSDLIDNNLSYDRYETKFKLRNLLTTGPSMSWMTDSLMVDASYGGNIITLPAALFQPPLLTPNLPEFVNYGILGSTIGHEIGHGYDGMEIFMDENEEPIAIAEQVEKNVTDYMGCFASLYDKLLNKSDSAEGEDSFGVQTLGENLSDAMGIHAVVDAYKKGLSKKRGVDRKLPNLQEFTDEQMLFISYGNIWCEIASEEFAEKQRKKDVHSPGRIRTLGALINSEEFSKAFNCPKGSPMNPEKKCNMWESMVKPKSRRRYGKHHTWVMN